MRGMASVIMAGPGTAIVSHSREPRSRTARCADDRWRTTQANSFFASVWPSVGPRQQSTEQEARLYAPYEALPSRLDCACSAEFTPLLRDPKAMPRQLMRASIRASLA